MQRMLLLFLLCSQAINSCGHPQSKHASQITTYLPWGWIFVCIALFYPTTKVAILQLRGAVEKIRKIDRLKIAEGRNKKIFLEEKESITEKRNP